MSTKFQSISNPTFASRETWLVARKQLLEKERELTHLHDEISAQRRALPWVKVEKDYTFETAEGSKTLSDLFEGRSQLFVYHFMLAPDSEDPCPGCSFIADHVDGARQHFEHADLSFAAVSRAQVEHIEQVKKRMGWKFTWASSFGNSFNYDYNASFTEEQVASGQIDYNFETTDSVNEDLPGVSIFAKDKDGIVYHTYSAYSRGGEILIGAFNFLDMVPKGRNETSTMNWVRLHDEYGDAPIAAHGSSEKSCCSCEEVAS